MLARKSLLHFANTVVGAILGILALKLVALYLGDSILGQVAYAMGLVGLVQALLRFGLPAAHTKRMSEGHRPADSLGTYLLTLTVILAVFIVGVVGFILFRIKVQGKPFEDTSVTILVAMTVYWTLKNYQTAGESTFNSQQEIARGQAAEFADNLVRTVTTILLTLVYAAAAKQTGPLASMLGPEWGWVATYGAELLAVTYLLGALAAVAVAFHYIRRNYEIGRFDPGLLRSYWDFARPLYIVSILTTLANKLDSVMIGYFWASGQVGLYFASTRITSLVNQVAFAAGAILMPTMSNLAVQDDTERIGALTGRSHRYIGMVVLPLVLFLVAFAGPVIHLLLSDQFLEAIPILQIMAAYSLLFVLSRPYSSLIQGMDRPELASIVGTSAAVTNIVLNVVLIPADIQVLGIELLGLKAMGAALATLSAGVVAYVLFHRIAHALVPVPPQWHHLLRQGASALAMAGLLILLHQHVMPFARWYHLFIYGGVGGLLYLGGLVLMREFTRDDLHFFLDTLHPLEMLRYVRDELFGDDGSQG